jgi:hypothetical protein
VNTTVVNNYYNTTVINKNTNVNNVTVNNQHYMNQGVPGAVTATTPQAFTSAQPVAKNIVQVNQREVASAAVSASAPQVAPPKQAVLGSGTPSSFRPPTSLANRAVVAKTAPPPPPVALLKQQQAIQANGGRPLATSQVRQIQPETAQAPRPNIKIAPAGKPVAPQNVQANKPVMPQSNSNRPATVNNATQPIQGNKPGTPSLNPANSKVYNDRPPAARPNNSTNTVAVNPQLDQKHQQQLQDLRAKQDQERQKIEQQQVQERQKLAQKNADDQRQQQLNQKHEQQLQQLEQKHGQDQQRLQQKQQQERQKQQPKQQEKPEKPPKEDKPHRG